MSAMTASASRPADVEGSAKPRGTTRTGNTGEGHGSTKPSAMEHGDRTEAVWAEMQNTLEEVELSVAGGANAFSAEHARALEALRKAQIELAQAWARSEAEDETTQGGGTSKADAAQEAEEGQRGALGAGVVFDDRGKSGAAGAYGMQDGVGASQGGWRGRSQLEEETENDIILARRRREANDRYFERVNRGVLEVVEKLDVVAEKMKNVEMDAQDIWGDRDSLESDSAG